MLRNFSELKSGGDNSYAVPAALKSGGGRVPPVPHRSTPMSIRVRLKVRLARLTFRVLHAFERECLASSYLRDYMHLDMEV